MIDSKLEEIKVIECKKDGVHFVLMSKISGNEIIHCSFAIGGIVLSENVCWN